MTRISNKMRILHNTFCPVVYKRKGRGQKLFNLNKAYFSRGRLAHMVKRPPCNNSTSTDSHLRQLYTKVFLAELIHNLFQSITKPLQPMRDPVL